MAYFSRHWWVSSNPSRSLIFDQLNFTPPHHDFFIPDLNREPLLFWIIYTDILLNQPPREHPLPTDPFDPYTDRLVNPSMDQRSTLTLMVANSSVELARSSSVHCGLACPYRNPRRSGASRAHGCSMNWWVRTGHARGPHATSACCWPKVIPSRSNHIESTEKPSHNHRASTSPSTRPSARRSRANNDSPPQDPSIIGLVEY